jgi:hypothetical protein
MKRMLLLGIVGSVCLRSADEAGQGSNEKCRSKECGRESRQMAPYGVKGRILNEVRHAKH